MNITTDELKTIRANYLKNIARESLHPAQCTANAKKHATTAIVEVMIALGIEHPAIELTSAHGEIFFSVCESANNNKHLAPALLPLFEGLPHRTGERKYGYKKTFYGLFCPWFYISSFQALHDQILTWGN